MALLKMSAEFASLGYFMQGYRDLKLAWKMVPSWLVNCVPFIVVPPSIEYDFEDVQVIEDSNSLMIEGNQYVAIGLMDEIVFANCFEGLNYFLESMQEAAVFAMQKDFQQFINTLARLGKAGQALAKVCGK